MGAKLTNRSCPAVSQISNLIVVSSSTSDFVRNAAVARVHRSEQPRSKRCWLERGRARPPPIVPSWYSKNWFRTNRSAMLVFPTDMFPSITTLNCISFGIPAPAPAPAANPRAAYRLQKECRDWPNPSAG